MKHPLQETASQSYKFILIPTGKLLLIVTIDAVMGDKKPFCDSLVMKST